jgi:hypothetical protein
MGTAAVEKAVVEKAEVGMAQVTARAMVALDPAMVPVTGLATVRI